MSKPPKVPHTEDAKSSGQRTAGKLRLYEILYTLNQGFEQVLQQLQEMEKLGLGRQHWKALQTIVEENRAEINFELVERLQSANRGTERTLDGCGASGRRSLQIRKMC